MLSIKGANDLQDLYIKTDFCFISGSLRLQQNHSHYNRAIMSFRTDSFNFLYRWTLKELEKMINLIRWYGISAVTNALVLIMIPLLVESYPLNTRTNGSNITNFEFGCDLIKRSLSLYGYHPCESLEFSHDTDIFLEFTFSWHTIACVVLEKLKAVILDIILPCTSTICGQIIHE